MANLFIGFPVPRAKIAEMIEGYAAPRFPYDNTIFHTWFESLAGYSRSETGSASIVIHNNYVTINITGTQGDIASFRKLPAYPHLANTWDLPRYMKVRAHVDCTAGIVGRFFIGVGVAGTNNAIGFGYVDGLLAAVVYQAGVEESSQIADWTTPAEHDVLLRWDYEPPAYPKFYLDGTLVYTATTKKPTGTDSADYYVEVYMANLVSGDVISIDISEWMFHQKGE